MSMPLLEVPPVRDRRPARSHVARRRARPRADLVLDRPARRQPGARQPDGLGAQAALLRPAPRARRQGDRGRLPVGVEDRLRLRADARRGGPDPGRHDDRRADAGAARADRAHLRGDRGRTARDRAPLQLDLGRRSAASSSGSTRRDHRARGPRDARSARSSRPRATRRSCSSTRPRASTTPSSTTRSRSARRWPTEWGPTPEEKMIVNLPTTVEQFPPNVYADRIEWFARHFSYRDAAISLRASAQRPRHRGRDGRARADGRRRARRGDAVRQRRAHRQRRPRHDRAQPAHAGRRPGARPLADRRGEARSSRSATSCPSIRAIRTPASSSTRRSRARTRTRSRRACTRRSGRAPRCGTCRTCRSTRRTSGAATRRSSASTRSRGRAASRTCMQAEHHLELPRGLQVDFAQTVQAITDARGGELTADELLGAVQRELPRPVEPYELVAYAHSSEEDADRIAASLRRRRRGARSSRARATARSPRSSTRSPERSDVDLRILDYHEHAMSRGEDATAAAYVEADVDDEVVWGVGIHPSIVTASLRAVVNAVNRALALRAAQEAAAAAFDAGGGRSG